MCAGTMASAIAEAFFPSLCVCCGEALPGSDRGLCSSCWAAVVPVAGVACPMCGGPGDSADAICLSCEADPPPQAGTVIWGEHAGVLRVVINALKHRSHDELARPLAERLAARVSVTSWATTLDLVTAVPSHTVHRIRRGWSAAELVARRVASALDLPFWSVLRRHGMARQAGRIRADRLRFPRRSFTARRQLEGLRVLMIDDVSTTGTTFRTAATVVLRAGAGAVYCAALASAPDPRRSL